MIKPISLPLFSKGKDVKSPKKLIKLQRKIKQIREIELFSLPLQSKLDYMADINRIKLVLVEKTAPINGCRNSWE